MRKEEEKERSNRRKWEPGFWSKYLPGSEAYQYPFCASRHEGAHLKLSAFHDLLMEDIGTTQCLDEARPGAFTKSTQAHRLHGGIAPLVSVPTLAEHCCQTQGWDLVALCGTGGWTQWSSWVPSNSGYSVSSTCLSPSTQVVSTGQNSCIFTCPAESGHILLAGTLCFSVSYFGIIF